MLASTAINSRPSLLPARAAARPCAAPARVGTLPLARPRAAARRQAPRPACVATPEAPSKGSVQVQRVEPGELTAAARCRRRNRLRSWMLYDSPITALARLGSPPTNSSALPTTLQPASPLSSTPRPDLCTGACRHAWSRASRRQHWIPPPAPTEGIFKTQRPPQHAAHATQPPTRRRSSLPPVLPGNRTLFDNWRESVGKYGPRPCLGRRVGSAYHYLTFEVSTLGLLGWGGRQSGTLQRAWRQRRRRRRPTDSIQRLRPCFSASPDALTYCSAAGPLARPQEADRMAADVAGAMVHCGLAPHARASVFGANCPEWMLTMQARACSWPGGGLQGGWTGCAAALPSGTLRAGCRLRHRHTAALLQPSTPTHPTYTPTGLQPADGVLRTAVRRAGGQHRGIHHRTQR